MESEHCPVLEAIRLGHFGSLGGLWSRDSSIISNALLMMFWTCFLIFLLV
jgi:hypothetical protein